MKEYSSFDIILKKFNIFNSDIKCTYKVVIFDLDLCIHDENYVLYSDIVDIVKWLYSQNIKLYIVSWNSNPYYFMIRHGISIYFKNIISCYPTHKHIIISKIINNNPLVKLCDFLFFDDQLCHTISVN